MSGFSGMWAWLVQRFTAIYIVLYLLGISLYLLINPVHDFAQWQSLFQPLTMQIASSVFMVALLFHTWIGLRDVILDYIHPVMIKVIVLATIVLMLLSSGYLFIRALFFL